MKKQCKNCGSKVEYFNIDYDAGKIRCFYCNHVLPNEMFFNDLTINKFAKKIPETRRDEFLEKLGFEKKPVKKGAIIAGIFVALIPLITSLNKFYKKKGDIKDLIFGLLPLIIVLVPTIKTLLDSKSHKYVKKR